MIRCKQKRPESATFLVRVSHRIYLSLKNFEICFPVNVTINQTTLRSDLIARASNFIGHAGKIQRQTRKHETKRYLKMSRTTRLICILVKDFEDVGIFPYYPLNLARIALQARVYLTQRVYRSWAIWISRSFSELFASLSVLLPEDSLAQPLCGRIFLENPYRIPRATGHRGSEQPRVSPSHRPRARDPRRRTTITESVGPLVSIAKL